MNYTTLARFRWSSLFLNKNIYVTSCCPTHINVNASKRTYSLQTSVDSTLKMQNGIFGQLSESVPVEYLQTFVTNVHDSTGLPWWATIICTTVLLRSVLTVPLQVYQYVMIARLQNVNAELLELSKELRNEVAISVQTYGWNNKEAQFNFKKLLKKQWDLLVVRDNCHPAKTGILVMVQLPLWVCVSVTLRNLVYMLPIKDSKALEIYSQLSVEGINWISNLTHADPLLILPITLAVINLSIIEIQTLARVNEASKLQRFIVIFFRCFSVAMVPIAANIPSGVVLFWTTSSAYGLMQNLIFMSPKVKRFFRIPQTPVELERPYSYIYHNFKKRLRLLPSIKQ